MSRLHTDWSQYGESSGLSNRETFADPWTSGNSMFQVFDPKRTENRDFSSTFRISSGTHGVLAQPAQYIH